jgi:site-specific recombinase XerD
LTKSRAVTWNASCTSSLRVRHPRGRARIRGGPGTAAKAVSLLSAIYNYALRKQWAGANPCVGVEKPADNRRQRYLKANEYGRLGTGLAEAERIGMNTNVLVAIVVLTFTGCRKGEILNLKREEIRRTRPLSETYGQQKRAAVAAVRTGRSQSFGQAASWWQRMGVSRWAWRRAAGEHS